MKEDVGVGWRCWGEGDEGDGGQSREGGGTGERGGEFEDEWMVEKTANQAWWAEQMWQCM